MTKNIYLILLLLLSSSLLHAQELLETTVDTTSIKIGDNFILTLKAKAGENAKVFFPDSEQIGPFEVLDSYPVDTLIKEQRWELIKKYALTQFDTGKYELPPLPVIIDNKQYQTVPIGIDVMGVEVDTLKQPMYEIKSIATGSHSFDADWFYLLACLLSILLGVAAYIYIKKKQKRNLSEDDLYRSPYEKAAKKLKKLEEKKSWTRGDPKSYYSEMTDITRSFIEDTFGISAHELTTQETILVLQQTLKSKKIKLHRSVIQELKKILQTADLVKFAKSQPLEFEIAADTEKMQKVVDSINTAYPISAETQTERIRQREERQKKRARTRTLIPLGLTVSLLLFTGLVYFLNHSSQRGVFKNLSFNSSKRLLNKEWVTSTYGVPGLTVSTPLVLERYFSPTIQQTLPPGVWDIQQFRSGLAVDPIQVFVNNIAFERNHSYDKNQILSHSINVLTESIDAKNVEYTKSDFENPNGTIGVKATGKFTLAHTAKKPVTMTFEIVMIEKKPDIDEVGIFYPEGDKTGAEIARRLFDSITYKTADNP